MPPRGGERSVEPLASSSSSMPPVRRENDGSGAVSGVNPGNGKGKSKSRSRRHNTNKDPAHSPASASRIRAAASSINPNAVIVASKQDTAVETLLSANQDLEVVSLTLKDIKINDQVADALCRVLRGQGRSWEGMAVDILRRQNHPSQGMAHARWQTISIQDCMQNDVDEDSTDACISSILALDACRRMHLCNVKLTPYAAQSLKNVGYCQALQTLSLDLLDLNVLGANRLTAISLLAEGLRNNSSLLAFRCCRCGLVDDQLAALLEALEDHHNLEELKLFGNRCRQGGLAAIAKILAHPSARLAVLDVSYQHVGEDDAFDISALAAALAKNSSLKSLDLDNDGIGDGHLGHLVAALSVNTSLSEVTLNHNRITDEGVALLSGKLPKMKGLKKISMYDNKFG